MLDYDRLSEINLKELVEGILKMNVRERELAVSHYKRLEEKYNIKEMAKSEYFQRWFFDTMEDKQY